MRISFVVAALAAASSVQTAHAQTQTVATPLNSNVINLLLPLSTLLGTTTIQQNLTNAISINNNSTVTQRNQALIDNTITTDNGVVLTDGLGVGLNNAWKNAGNSQAANGNTTNSSANVQALFRTINAFSQDDSGKAKNFFADGSANGTSFISNANLSLGKTATSNTPIVGISLPAGGVFDVYDKAYGPIVQQNRTGNSRPFQVNPANIVAFSGNDFFGNPTSNTTIMGTNTANSGSGLFANASLPSGHTTFGYTTSLLLGMLVPERYDQMLTRASEYGNSRVVLGVHYPLDVIAGRVIGTYDVVQMLNNNPQYTNATVNGVFNPANPAQPISLTAPGNFQTLFVAAQTDMRNQLQAQCGTTIAACIAAGGQDRFSNLAQDKADYIARLTYGLPTFSFAQAPREAAPTGGPDASILLATIYGGSSTAAKVIAPNGGMLGSLSTNTINQIIVNTETNALQAFYGTALSYWARLDLFSASTYFQGMIGTLNTASTDVINTDVTVANTGVLAGTATVNGNTIVQAGGALQPGDGTAGSKLTLNGNLAFQSGALYLVQVSTAGAPFTSVTGTATLAGNVQVSSPTGGYKFGQMTILTSGGLGGTRFDALTTPTGITGALAYTPTNVQLSLTSSLSSIPGQTGNQRAVGLALDSAFNSIGSSGPLGAIFSGNVLQNLQQAAGESTTAPQQTTFNAMSQFLNLMLDPNGGGRGPETSPATGFADESDTAMGYAAARKRTGKEREAFNMFTKAPLRTVYDPHWSVWAAGFGGSQTTNGNLQMGTNDTRSQVFGGAVGADYWFSPKTVAGFSLAGGGTSFSVANNFGYGRSDLFQAGAFVRHTEGAAYIAGALAYGWQDVTTDRTVTIAGLDKLHAEFHPNTYSGRIEGGYRFVAPVFGGFGITPYAAGQFTTIDLPTYVETATVGANTFALANNARSVTDTRSELGVRTDKSFAVQTGLLTFRGRLAWAHDYNPDRTAAVTFQALPVAAFTVNGAKQASDSVLTTSAIEWRWLNGWSAGASIEGEFSNVTTSYAGKGVVRYTW